MSGALGLIAGASFGLPLGWLMLQLCLFGLLRPLSSISTRPSSAGVAFFAFTAAMMSAGLTGFALGVPPSARALTLIPLLLLIAASAISTSFLAWLCFRLVSEPVFRLAVAIPCAWMVHEWAFSLGDASVPWLRLGYAQASTGPLLGALSLGGVLLAGGLMVSLSGLLALGWSASAARQRPRLAAGAAIMLAISAIGFTDWTTPSGSLSATLIQSGLANKTGAASHTSGIAKTLAAISNAARSGPANLIVTAELALPKTTAALPSAFLHDLQSTLASKSGDALLGIHFSDNNTPGFYNGALGLGASGEQRYLKSKLFPFGEFLPLSDRLSAWVNAGLPQALTPTLRGEADFEPMLLAGHRAAIAICIEAAHTDSWRRRAATADFLVNMTNDSAVASAQVVRQARAMAQVRAMEFQKPLLRVSDSDGTFAVTASGRVQSELPGGAALTSLAQIETRVGLTPYARWGDAVPLAIVLIAAGFLMLRRITAETKQPKAALPSGNLLTAGMKSARGQVLPLAVGMLLIVAAFLYLMVNSGQSVTEKIRVTNAADAAAYSAGVAEARALNYSAYLNRAMVANEIVIAQTVSLASWSNYFAKAIPGYAAAAAEINFFLLPNPGVLQLDAVFLGAGYLSAMAGTNPDEYAKQVNQVLDVAVFTLNAAAQSLSLAQEVVQLEQNTGRRQFDLANSVVKAMDPALNAVVVPVSLDMGSFTSSYARNASAGDLRGRMADVTLRSRDAFTRERNWEVSSFNFPFVRKDGALKKRGGTDLIGFDEWRAVDTLELHGERFGCGKFGLSWCGDVQTRVGQGAALASADGGDAGRGHHGNAYSENARTAATADSEMRAASTFSGIPDSRDVANLDPTAVQTTGITIRVSKDHASTLTSANAAQFKTTGALDLYSSRPAGGQMAALSRAEVFYDRIAARADGRTELASLYNPYWRVRLVAPTASDKVFSAALQGGLALP